MMNGVMDGLGDACVAAVELVASDGVLMESEDDEDDEDECAGDVVDGGSGRMCWVG